MKRAYPFVALIAFLAATVASACHGTTEDPLNLGPKTEPPHAAPVVDLAPTLSEEELAQAERCGCESVAPTGIPPHPTSCATDCLSPPADNALPLELSPTTTATLLLQPFEPFHSFPPLHAADDLACPGDTQLPEGCMLLNETTLDRARWLQCHRSRDNRCSELCCRVAAPDLAACSLTHEQVTQIAAGCADGLPEERMRCASDKTQSALHGSGTACRHHTRCMSPVLAAMAMPIELKTSTTHAWTEVTSAPNGTYIIDAHNSIYYWCP